MLIKEAPKTKALKTFQKSGLLYAFIKRAIVAKMNKINPTKCVNTLANSSDTEALIPLFFRPTFSNYRSPDLKVSNNFI